MSKLVITSGYFDPIHPGHIELLQKAKELGDFLVVIINNDNQAKLKKDKAFMSETNRQKIITAIKYVDLAVLSIDTDSTVCSTVEYLAKWFGKRYEKMIFAKGGDRFAKEVPEFIVCQKYGIEIVDGLGEKIDSSKNYYLKK